MSVKKIKILNVFLYYPLLYYDGGKKKTVMQKVNTSLRNHGLGMVAHVCNLSTLRGRGRDITSLTNMKKLHLY